MKKGIWISVIVAVLFLLIASGAYFLFSGVSEIERKDYRAALFSCMLECPMLSEKIDYINGMGNLGPEGIMAEYGGVERRYYYNSDCIIACNAQAQVDSGISESEYIDRDSGRASELTVPVACALTEFVPEKMEECLVKELRKDYSDSEIASMRAEYSN